MRHLIRRALTSPGRALRAAVQTGGLRPLLRRTVDLEVHGRDDLETLSGPVVLAANHSSHLDTPVLLDSLPRARRARTAVAVAPGYSSRSREAGAAVAFATTAKGVERLRRGDSVVVYPEVTRSTDGYLSPFGSAAAELARVAQVPVVPVGLRGTYAAMPRGRSWPLPGRTRVSIRYGRALEPAAGEEDAAFSERIEAAVRALLAEDETTWWAARRGHGPNQPDPPPGSWRRVWAQTQPPRSAGQPARLRVWRT